MTTHKPFSTIAMINTLLTVLKCSFSHGGRAILILFALVWTSAIAQQLLPGSTSSSGSSEQTTTTSESVPSFETPTLTALPGDFAQIRDQWQAQLEPIEDEVTAGQALNDQQREVVAKIRAQADEFRNEAKSEATYYTRLLEALGEPAAEGEQAESEVVATERERLQKNQALYYAQERLSRLIIERVDILTDNSVTDEQNIRLENLWQQRQPLTWMSTWQQIMTDVGSIAFYNQWAYVVQAMFWLVAQAAGYLLLFALLHRFSIAYFSRVEQRFEERPVSAWFKLYIRFINFFVNIALAIVAWIAIVWLINYLGLPAFDIELTEIPFVRSFFAGEAIKTPYLMNMILYSTLAYVLFRAVLAPRNTWWGFLDLNLARARMLAYQVPVMILSTLLLYRINESLGTVGFSESVVSLVVTVGIVALCIWVHYARKAFLKMRPECDQDTSFVQGIASDHPLRWLFNFVNRVIFGVTIAIAILAILGYQRMAVRLGVSMSLTAVLVMVFLAIKAVTAVLVEQFAYYVRRESSPDLIATQATELEVAAEDEEQETSPDMLMITTKIVVNIMLISIFVLLLLLAWGYPVEQLQVQLGRIAEGVTVGDSTVSLQKIGLGILILVLGVMLAGFIKHSIVRSDVLSKAASEGVRYSIGTILQYIFIVIAFLSAVAFMGINLASFSLFAGALGIGIGFGLQSIVQNFVSGLILLIQRPLEVGDWVEIATSSGIVKRVNLMNTELKTFPNDVVVLPNSDVMSATFLNHTRGERHGRVDVQIGVAYGTDAEKVKSILYDIAYKHPMAMKFEPIQVLLVNFGESSLDFELRFFTHDVLNAFPLSSDIRYLINERFRAEGIEIPFPQRVLHRPPSIKDIDEDTDEIIGDDGND